MFRGGHGGCQRVAWEPVRAPASCFGCKQTQGQSVQGRLRAREKKEQTGTLSLAQWNSSRDRASWFIYRFCNVPHSSHGWWTQHMRNDILSCFVMPTWLYLIADATWCLMKSQQYRGEKKSSIEFVVKTRLQAVGNEREPIDLGKSAFGDSVNGSTFTVQSRCTALHMNRVSHRSDTAWL